MVSIGDILPLTRVVLDLEVSSRKRLFETVGKLIADPVSAEQVDAIEETEEANTQLATDVFESLFDRERLGSTGFGNGVAIPHGRLECIKQAMGVLIRLKEAIDFDASDNKPVSLVFALLVPKEETNEYLEILSRLAERLSNPEVRECLLSCDDAQTARDLVIN